MYQLNPLLENSAIPSPVTKMLIMQELQADIQDFTDKIPDGTFTAFFIYHKHGAFIKQPEFRKLISKEVLQKMYSTIQKYVDAYEAYVMIHNKRVVAFKYEIFAAACSFSSCKY